MSHPFGIFSEPTPALPAHPALPMSSSAEPTKTHRLLDLLAFLVAHHFPVTRAQIWEGVTGYRRPLETGTDEASVRRTFERDKRELLDLGFPLETVSNPGGESDEQQLYRLRPRDFYLPYLRLIDEAREGGEEGEDADAPRLRARPRPPSTPPAPLDPDTLLRAARALHRLRENPSLPFHAEAGSAFRKLTFDLVGDAMGGWDELFGPPPVLVPGDDTETRGLVPILARAVRTRHVVRFTYQGITRDSPTPRAVEPHALLHARSRWYLIGHDRGRDEQRTFRLSRIVEFEPPEEESEGGPPEFDPPEVDLEAWHRAEAWNLPGMEEPGVEAVVRFRFPRSLWADRNGVGELVEREKDGSALRRFTVRSRDPFLRWLLGQLDDVELLEPAAFQAPLEAMRRRVIAFNPSLFAPEGDA
ncbi:MAG: WYL domain-containing protein [Longimicrobiales bacterium]|nr:WYL domain-containing protein [Longimicrobiales bacterium]